MIQCSLAFHHFPDVRATTAILGSFLKPCGKLFVADHMPHDASIHKRSGLVDELLPSGTSHEQALSAITHRAGFSEDTMKEMVEGAGLAFEWIPSVGKVEHGSKKLEVFLAIGTRSATMSDTSI